MKKLLSIAALSLLTLSSLLTAPSQAATATGQFDVTINLTSACKYTKTSDVAFNYTSLQTGAQAQTTSGGFTVQCTNSLPYTLALDGGPGLTTSYTAIGLNYDLTLSAGGATGNGLAQTYGVTGSIGAGQAGTCATSGSACVSTSARTLTISY